jgi:hypothetical protein
MFSYQQIDKYITKIRQILKDNGILFLKCFSDKEPREEGPYKFSQGEIWLYLEMNCIYIQGLRSLSLASMKSMLSYVLYRSVKDVGVLSYLCS